MTVAVGLLPAWNIHLVGRQVLQRHNFTYGHPIFRTDYERWVNQSTNPKVSKDVGLAFRGYARPGDSLVVGMFGAIGYYSNLFIYDRYGLVNREVALLPHGDAPLRSPGHDFKVERSFFLKSEPTFITHLVIDGPRIREQAIDAANGWRKLWVWRTYFPDFIVVGNSSVADAERIVMVLRAVDEEPDNLVRKLPRPERRRVRAKRATTLWEDFYRRANYLPDH